MMLWIILGVVVLIIIWTVFIYNRLIGLRNEVRNAWNQIDVQLKRRHDLIPNLVSTVKGAMEFEQDTLEKVMNARAKAVSAPTVHARVEAENGLSQALGRLFMVMENYPQLKSHGNIMQLQEELTSTENRISFARQLYNDLVANYRTRQEVFPDSIVASLSATFVKEPFFQAEEADRAVPQADITIRR